MIELNKDTEVSSYLQRILINVCSQSRAHKRRTVCRVIGRARASTQKFNLTRMSARLYGKAGFMPGFVKASW